MIKLRLTEDQFIRSVSLITENRESQARDRSLQVIRDYFAVTMPYWNVDDVFNHPDNPDRLSNLDYMFKCFEEVFFHDPKLRSSQIIRLEPAFVKMAFDAGFQQGHNDARRLNRIRKIIWRMYHAAKSSEEEAKVITKIPLDVSFEQLDERYGVQIDNENTEETDRINSIEYSENGEYKIIGPVNFNTAHKYAEYTGDMQNDATKMCYGMFRGTWEDYTNDDNYNVYILLKDGWKELQPVHDDEDEESAYDTYGMSMIFVIVDEDGNLKTCNTRWNHEANYHADHDVDFALDETELSELVGRPFSEVFKPKAQMTFEERVEMILDKLNDNMDDDYLTDDDISEFFDNFREYEGNVYGVKLNGKSNYLIWDDCFHFLSEQWFDAVGNYTMVNDDYGLGLVQLNDYGYNFIKNDGTFLFDEWLQGADNFKGKHSIILKGGQTYVIDVYGNMYNNKEEVFSEIANIAKNGGNILEQVDTCQYCGNNYYKVVLFDKENILFNGKLLSPELWFHEVFINNNSMSARRFPVIYSEDNNIFQCNYLKTEGGLLLPNWVDKVSYFKYTYCFYAEIKNNGETYCIDINGNKISE